MLAARTSQSNAIKSNVRPDQLRDFRQQHVAACGQGYIDETHICALTHHAIGTLDALLRRIPQLPCQTAHHKVSR